MGPIREPTMGWCRGMRDTRSAQRAECATSRVRQSSTRLGERLGRAAKQSGDVPSRFGELVWHPIRYNRPQRAAPPVANMHLSRILSSRLLQPALQCVLTWIARDRDARDRRPRRLDCLNKAILHSSPDKGVPMPRTRHLSSKLHSGYGRSRMPNAACTNSLEPIARTQAERNCSVSPSLDVRSPKLADASRGETCCNTS